MEREELTRLGAQAAADLFAPDLDAERTEHADVDEGNSARGRPTDDLGDMADLTVELGRQQVVALAPRRVRQCDELGCLVDRQREEANVADAIGPCLRLDRG